MPPLFYRVRPGLVPWDRGALKVHAVISCGLGSDLEFKGRTWHHENSYVQIGVWP
jgi:hypothetical protein